MASLGTVSRMRGLLLHGRTSCDVERRYLIPRLLRMVLATLIVFGDIVDALFHRRLGSTP